MSMDPDFMTRYLREDTDADPASSRRIDDELSIAPPWLPETPGLPPTPNIDDVDAAAVFAASTRNGHTNGDHYPGGSGTESVWPQAYPRAEVRSDVPPTGVYADAESEHRGSQAPSVEFAPEPPQYHHAPETNGVNRFDDHDVAVAVRPTGAGGAVSAFAPSTAAPAHLRAEDVVRVRKVPPEMGWRKTVYVASGHTINLGAGPAEQRLRDEIALIRGNIPGNYQIGVVCARGGVGKTRTAAGLGTAYASHRKEPVIAIDANPTYGGLGRLVDPTATASIREFLADTSVVSYPRARHYTGQNKQGLEVLGANQNVANPLHLSPQLFAAILARTRRFYQLAIIDCGPEIEHPVMEAVLTSVDALVIVGTLNYDGAIAAETTINWLAARSDLQDLLPRSALVLNDAYHSADTALLTKVRETMGRRVGGVTTIPWDAHLRDGAALDFDALARQTRLAYLELAAWLAQGFSSAKWGMA
jgi:MinD-like ATPase involved in chromosome partitioning or flagellar assembly